MPNAPQFSSQTRLLILSIATLFGISLFVQQMYFARRVHAASSFGAGNLVVYRVGDGSAALGANATAVFLDEYTPAGVLVQSIPLPTVVSAPNKRLTASGTSTSEGFITRSVDGNFLTLAGYDAALGTAVATSASSTVNRVIGRVDPSGSVDTTTALSDAISGGNPRGAVTTNGTDMWISGTSSGGGIRYASFGSTTSTALSTAVTNLRAVNIFGGQLYVSSASGTTRLVAVGTGTPTSSGQTLNGIPGLDSTTLTGPYAFFFADLSVGVAGNDTLYVADEGANQIKKFSLVGGTWTANGNIACATVRGITGTTSGSNTTLYVTFSSGTILSSLTDTSGYNATITGTLSTIATAGTNTLFRGVALAPSGVTPTPTPTPTSTPTPSPSPPSGVGLATPNSVLPGEVSKLTVNVTPGTNPTSTGIAVSADLSSIGGSNSQQLFDDGSNGDVTPNNNVFTYDAAVSGITTPGPKTLPFTINDAELRSGNGSISLTVQTPPPPADHVVISQLYGGGGNLGASYTNDYVELYNPTGVSFTLTGWSLQYASAAGTSWTNKQPLGGTIAPGEYYLVSLGSGGANGSPLPAANISGDINMSATTGKMALVNNSISLFGGCPLGTDPDIVDFVGYGVSANCHEGAANAPAPSNTNAIFRKNNGATDTDQNGSDFITAAANPRRTAPIVELGPWVGGTDPITNGTTVPYDATITIDFSEPVDVFDAWYDISCASGQHNSATVASYNDSKGYHITPNVSFQFGEQCTVTIFKDQVHDQDLDDSGADTDTLFANYVWSFTVVGAGQPAPYPPTVHLTMGNPSNATPLVTNPNNYLMEKPTYTLSYNRDKGTPNWVSWHLDQSWFGSLARVDTFRADPKVSPDWYRVQATDYFSSGFDRGHMTPNADRDNENRIPINQETYLMTNMVPQAPDNNQGPWANMENDLRSLLGGATNEIYIVSGPVGVGGTGSNGGTTNTIADGHVTVPAFTWKVALVLPKGEDDVSRVTCGSRTIAILMPNTQGIRNDPWENYLTTVDAVEQLTGYDFFSNLPDAVENCVEAGNNGTNPPGTANQSANTSEDTPVQITLDAVRSNNNTLTYSIVSGPTNGSLGSISAASCTGGACTATVTYTPGVDYSGSDTFTFKASDGAIDSNVSTVSITITAVNDPPTAAGDSYSTNSNVTLNVPAPGVLSNDTDIDGGALSAVLVSTVSHGALTLNADGSFSYTPGLDYAGSDSFTYSAFDGTANSNEATVSITVNDTVAPNLTSSVDTSLITTTNSNLINVGLAASADDNSGDLVTIQVAVFGDEDDQTPTFNNVLHSPDAMDIAPMTLRLRGERVEANDGRVYLIVITATDSSNNVSRNYQTVVVPKNNKQASIDSVNTQAAAAITYAQTHGGAPPAGYFVIGDGPIIGPKQ